MKNISIFITGGTFDKAYNELNGTLFFKQTHLHEMLYLGRSKLSLDIEELMLIDSLDMTDKHRRIILERCLQTKNNKIVIIHGTDTMVETATFLASRVLNKSIVFTGAMVPYCFGSSDGLFNLGSALAFAQTLQNGIYIAMNGQYFLWNEVHKNKTKGLFEKIKLK